MAVYNWLGRALAVAQVVSLTPGGTIEVGDIFNVTINGKTVSYVAAGTTVASVTAGLAAALQARTEAEFTAITWADGTTKVTGTAVTAGVPFTVTVSTTETGGGAADAQTFAASTTTAATGPNHWDNVNNWDQGAAPGTGDSANVDLSLASVLYGLDQNTVTLASLYVYTTTFTQNTMGLPRINAAGYTEYLDDYLKISATASVIDADSPLIKINFGSNANATEVRRTGTSSAPPTPAVLLKGTSGSNTLDIVSGNVGLAFYEGESYAAASATAAQAATVVVGTGAVIADGVSVGQIVFQGTGTNFQCDGGTADIRGTPGFSTLTCSGGQTFARFSGTIADVTVGPGQLDASQDTSARTFTNCTLVAGGQIIDPNETIVYPNGITLEPGVSSVQAA